MVVTRSKRKLFDLEPPSPNVELTDETVFTYFSLAKIANMSTNIIGESSCNWHSSHKEAFIQLIEEEFDTDRMRTNNTLSAKQVNEISYKLKERIGQTYNVAQIKAKFAIMKAKTSAFHSWSSETNTITMKENV
ncbi:hypothetical protein LguiA_012386 [Lonicera macranthoides]